MHCMVHHKNGFVVYAYITTCCDLTNKLQCSDGKTYEHGVKYGGPENIHKVDLKEYSIIGVAVSKKRAPSGTVVVDQISFIAASSREQVLFGPYGGSGKGGMRHVTVGNIRAIKGNSGAAIDSIEFLGEQY